MKTKIVIVRLEEDCTKKPYLFEAPYDVVKGDHLLVETRRGEKAAVALYNSVSVDDETLELMKMVYGGKKLMPVLGVFAKYDELTPCFALGNEKPIGNWEEVDTKVWRNLD